MIGWYGGGCEPAATPRTGAALGNGALRLCGWGSLRCPYSWGCGCARATLTCAWGRHMSGSCSQAGAEEAAGRAAVAASWHAKEPQGIARTREGYAVRARKCTRPVPVHRIAQEEEVEKRAEEVNRLREEVANLGARASALGEMAAPLEAKLLAAKERVEQAEKAVGVQLQVPWPGLARLHGGVCGCSCGLCWHMCSADGCVHVAASLKAFFCSAYQQHLAHARSAILARPIQQRRPCRFLSLAPGPSTAWAPPS